MESSLVGAEGYGRISGLGSGIVSTEVFHGGPGSDVGSAEGFVIIVFWGTWVCPGRDGCG